MHVFRRLVATSRAPQSMVVSMLRRFGKNLPNMGVAVPRAPVGIRSPEPPQKFGHGP